MDEHSIAQQPTYALKAPWIRQHGFKIRGGRFRIDVYDQPGRWMEPQALEALHRTLSNVAAESMDEVPTYGVFSGDRQAFSNRLVGVMIRTADEEPVAFTAMVYLPILMQGRVEPVIHLGLTMINRSNRGLRLQGPLFEKLFYLPVLNQFRLRFVLTNIAASPAGIGSVSDYFEDAYPSYRGHTTRQPYHVEVAEKLLTHYRHEFGCSQEATFDPETFVVAGSNDPESGGAYQFIREDPVSRYKHDACNEFCAARLRYERGDELLQVARLNMVRGVIGIIGRIGSRRKAAAAAAARTRVPTPTAPAPSAYADRFPARGAATLTPPPAPVDRASASL